MRYGILRPRIIGAVAIVMVAVLVGIAGYNAYRQAFGTIRAQHYADILAGNPKIDWFEVISENYICLLYTSDAADE